MDTLAFISWDVNPNIIESPIMIRYYGLLMAISFITGYYIVRKFLVNEGADAEWIDKFLFYTLIGGVVGARLGHVFFYDWKDYKDNLLDIFKIWEGGLASHGGTIGVIVSTWLLSKRVTKKNILWALDKIVIAAAIAACFIRVGNLMNSEIIGAKSESESAFFFQYEAKNTIGSWFDLSGEDVLIEELNGSVELDGFTYPKAKAIINIPAELKGSEINLYSNFDYRYEHFHSELKHHFIQIGKGPEIIESEAGNAVMIDLLIIPRIPTQLIESGSYFLIFILLFIGYWKLLWYKKQGLLFGMFLVLLFSARFIIEFWKEHQTLDGGASLNMGQWLSIPAVSIGLFFIVRALMKKSVENEKTESK
jgi:phosphatidylglycerol---prolipoprotein diacylglyceryl transferase